MVGVGGSDKLADISTAPQSTCQVLATCHSLIHVEDQLIGTLSALGTASLAPAEPSRGPGAEPWRGLGLGSLKVVEEQLIGT